MTFTPLLFTILFIQDTKNRMDSNNTWTEITLD